MLVVLPRSLRNDSFRLYDTIDVQRRAECHRAIDTLREYVHVPFLLVGAGRLITENLGTGGGRQARELHDDKGSQRN